MVEPNNVFDLWDVFVNEIVGSPVLFIILGLAFILFLCLKYQIPSSVGFMFGILFLLLMVNTQYVVVALIAAVLIIGVVLYAGIAKVLR